MADGSCGKGALLKLEVEPSAYGVNFLLGYPVSPNAEGDVWSVEGGGGELEVEGITLNKAWEWGSSSQTSCSSGQAKGVNWGLSSCIFHPVATILPFVWEIVLVFMKSGYASCWVICFLEGFFSVYFDLSGPSQANEYRVCSYERNAV